MFESYSPPTSLEGYAELNRRVEAMKEGNLEAYRQTKRWLCQQDLFYFERYVSMQRFGMKWLTALDGSLTPEYRCFLDAPIVIRMARVMETLGNHYLLIGGRGLVKSTLHVGEVIRQILINPDVKILCVASIKALAMLTVGKVATEIEQNAELRWLFPEIFYPEQRRDSRRHGKRWGNESLEVKRSAAHKEGTVDAAGCLDAKGLPIGVHYHRIMGDDMEEPKNVTEQVLPSLLAVREKIPPLTAGHGSVWNTIGTFHHANGLHAKGLPDVGWQTLSIPAVDMDNVPNGYVEVTFGNSTRKVWYHELGGTPIYDTAEFLADKFLSMGARAYGSQYLCKLPNAVNRSLDHKLIRWYAADKGSITYYPLDPNVILHSKKVLLVDPAHNKKALGSDPTCMLVVGLYKSGTDKRVIVLDGYYSPFLSRPGRLYVASQLILKWGIKQVRWEAFGAVEDHLELPGYLKTKFGLDPKGLVVTPYTTVVKKETRAVEILQPLLLAGELYVPAKLIINKYPAQNDREGVPFVQEQDIASLVKAEFAAFPDGGKHIIDTLGMVSEVNSKKGKQRRPDLQYGDESTYEEKQQERPRIHLVRPAAPFMF